MMPTPCARQAALTFDWSRKGCISIWLQTSGSGASRTASSMSATVKLETPMCRASPICLTLHRAPSVSASGTCGFGQCKSNRSTSESRSRARLALAARSSACGAKCDGQTLVVMKMSLRATPEARTASPTSRSLSYISAVSTCRYPSRNARSTTRAQTRPRRSQVPSPTNGMRAPFTLITCMIVPAGGLWSPDLLRELGRGQHREGQIRRPVEHFEQRARGPARRALALLPIAHRLDRHPDPGGEFRLGQFGAGADPLGIGGIQPLIERRHLFGGGGPA